MKLSFRLLLVILFIHIICVLPLINPGIPSNHDAQLHTARLAAYYKAFEDGQVVPRWAADLNYRYGTPLFIFYAPLSGYLGSFFHWLGASFEVSYKILIAGAFVLAPVTFYLWMLHLFPPPVAFISALFYGLAPYHFLDLYVRGAISELMFLAIVPLLFLAIERVRKLVSLPTILFAGVIYGILIISQNIMALIFSVVALSYSLIRLSLDRKTIMYLIVIFFTGLSLSAFYWIPAFVEQKYTHSQLFIAKKYTEHFPSPFQLVISPWGYGTDVRKPGGLSPQIGPLYTVIALIGLFLLRKIIKTYKRLTYWALGVLGLAIFFSLRFSSIFWNIIPFMQKFEFPWRFTAVSSFAIAVISAAVFFTLKHKIIHSVAIIFLLLSSITFIASQPFETNSDSYYSSYGSSTDFGAVTPVWTAGDPYENPKHPVEIIGGIGNISDYRRLATRHTFRVNAQTDMSILDNTLYFPGWQARIDGTKTPIEFQNSNHRGLITLNVPQGTHAIEVSFHDSPVRFVANIISIATIVVSLFSYILYKWIKLKGVTSLL